MPAGRHTESRKEEERPIPSMQCVYDHNLKEWDAGFIAESTPQQRASILEQLEAKGWNP